MTVLRQLDLVVLALALPVFLAAGFPLVGYAAAAAAWLVQRVIKTVFERHAKASEDARTAVGLTAGSMLIRGWLVALTILLVGLAENDAGLAAAVLVIVLFTIHFTLSMMLRPFEQRPEGGR